MQQIKKAIVLVSFGVSDPRQQAACIEPLVQDIRREFPGWVVEEAYTSAMIRRRLAAAGGILIPSLEEVLAKLAAAGFTRVVVQPSHITPGEEYDLKIQPAVQRFREQFSWLRLGRPAFFFTGEAGKPNDYAIGLQALLTEFQLQPEEELVLMGHGSPHRHNRVYERLQRSADDAGIPVHIGVLEPGDTPTVEDVLQRLRAGGRKKVLLAPMLLVGGRHTARDLAGEEPSSWKSRLQAAGYEVRLYLHGLGESASFRAVYLQHLHDLVD